MSIKFKIVPIDDLIILENDIVQTVGGLSVSASIDHIKYQRHYMDTYFENLKHYNLEISINGQEIVGYCLFSIISENNNFTVQTVPGYMYFPYLRQKLKTALINNIREAFLETIKNLCSDRETTCKIAPIKIPYEKYKQNTFMSQMDLNLSSIHSHKSEYKTIISTNKGENVLWSDIRKSYRNLINQSQKNIIFDISENYIKLETWALFRELHRKESGGRSIRSSASWNYQYNLILSGKAALICAYERSSNQFLGAGFFEYNKFECVYSVAAYDRDKFHLPISHGVIWNAVKMCCSKGISYLDLGERLIKFDDETKTKKEKNISLFKSGFSKDVIREYSYQVNV